MRLALGVTSLLICVSATTASVFFSFAAPQHQVVSSRVAFISMLAFGVATEAWKSVQVTEVNERSKEYLIAAIQQELSTGTQTEIEANRHREPESILLESLQLVGEHIRHRGFGSGTRYITLLSLYLRGDLRLGSFNRADDLKVVSLRRNTLWREIGRSRKCDQCLYYSGDRALPCAVNPFGAMAGGEGCLDYQFHFPRESLTPCLSDVSKASKPSCLRLSSLYEGES